MNASQIKDTLQEHHRIEEAFRQELIELFDSFPENEEVTKISSNPECFSVPISTIAKYGAAVLSPEFYSFPLQWQRLQKILRNGDNLEKQLSKLSSVAATGNLSIQENGQKYSIKLHPAVVGRLKEILAA